MSDATTYVHPTSGETLLPILRKFLPNSLPLYRRLSHSFKSETAYALATFPPSTSTTEGIADSNYEHDLPPCFAAAFVDRSHRPATEMWLFLSGEIEGRCNCANDLGVKPIGDVVSPEEQARIEELQSANPASHPAAHDTRSPPRSPCANALLSLMKYISKHVSWQPHSPERLADVERAVNLVKELKASKPQNAEAMKSHYPEHGFFLQDVHNPRALKLGASATLPTTILHLHGLLSGLPGRATAHSIYTFCVPDGLPKGRELEDGLKWGKVAEKDFDLVRVRSPIPRTHRTLRIWDSVGVYPAEKGAADGEQNTKEAAVAWAFVGYDGSLSSMHVEPEYRGKGIAKTLATKLLSEYPQTDGWALAYVGVGNRESEAVCKGIGGDVKTWSWWLRIDMAAVENLNL